MTVNLHIFVNSVINSNSSYQQPLGWICFPCLMANQLKLTYISLCRRWKQYERPATIGMDRERVKELSGISMV